jgi:release factor glutamine methyltransferase
MLNAITPTLAHLLEDARLRLARTLGLPETEAGIEARLLMRHALGGVTHAWLIAHQRELLTPQQAEAFAALLAQRLAGWPVAYLLGAREFFGLEFRVTPEVLIPRPDTELLVEAALQQIPVEAAWRVLDLGTGSGAIAIAIAIHRPRVRITAVDRSQAALAVAQANARRLQAGAVRFRHSHWFHALEGETFHLIVGNPPYIAQDDPHLGQGDLRFEPVQALVSGVDGLDDIRAIVEAAPRYLVAGGWLLLEHGYDQAERVAGLLRQAGFDEVISLPDLAGILRVTRGRLPE